MTDRPKHLYRDDAKEAELREFERRYGVEHGQVVYGEVVGKVARERAAKNGGTIEENVKGHMSFSSKGTEFRVKPFKRRVVAHPHSYGEHKGPCSAACRRGEVAHRHPRGSRR